MRNSGRPCVRLISFGLGLAVVAFLIGADDFHALLQTISSVRYGFVTIVALRLAVIALMTLCWQALLSNGDAPSFQRMFVARWIGESVNSLLPVAQFGGDLLRAYLVRAADAERGLHQSIASVMVDMTLNLVVQSGLAWLGVWHIWPMVSQKPLLFLACVVAGLPPVAIAFSQMDAALRGAARAIGGLRIAPCDLSMSAAGQMSLVIARIYRQRRTVMVAAMCHLAAALGRSIEAWLILSIMEYEVSVLDAVMIEGLTGAFRTIVFFLPAGLGVQEGAIFILCSWIGVPPTAALALALVKRAREILVGTAGLLAWVIIGRQFTPRIS